MKVVDLHPEELFDKEEAGTISDAERARLDAHVARCETCRLERRLRADFAAELGDEAEESRFPSNYLVAIVAGAQRSEGAEAAKPTPKAEPEPPREDAPEEDEAEPTPLRRPTPRRRARWVVLLAAAAVAVVSVAAASETSGGRWVRRVVGVDATENEVETPTSRAAAKAAPGEVAVPSPHVAKPLASETEPAPAVDEIPVPAPSAAVVAPPVVAKAAAPVAAPLAAPRASAPDPRWAPAEPEGAAALLEEATLARRRGDYARAVTLARRLQASFPDTREAHVSQATLGRLLLDTGDPAGALASFDAYLARRGGQLDETAMVGRGIALDRLGREAEARAAWAALLEAFPASPYAEHARTRGR